KLQPAHLFHVCVGASGLVCFQNLDLPLAEQSALGIYLFRRQEIAFVHRLAEDGPRAGKESHVPNAKPPIRNVSLWFLLSAGNSGNSDPRRGRSKSGSGGDAQFRKKIPSSGFAWHVLPPNCGVLQPY